MLYCVVMIFVKGGFQMDRENNNFDLDDLIFGPNYGPVLSDR